MYPRINYEMTQADLDKILEACKPTPAMFLPGGQSMFKSPQENANDAWAELGRRMGFDHMTVRPVSGKGDLFFTAVPNETETQRADRLAREAEETLRRKVATLQAEIDDRQKQLTALLQP